MALENTIILIDKPQDWSSFDVIRKLKKPLRLKKVGHAGTLDPLATGLLILCTGKFTKKITELQTLEKEYIATVRLGATTKSDDAEFPEENIKDTSRLTKEMVEKALQKFLGEIEQVPPYFSAVKVKGKRAYELARKNPEELQKIPLKPKKVFIKNIEIIDFREKEIDLKIICGKGTYIRSLARDLGKELGVGGYVKKLRRTRIGEYKVEEAFSPEDLLKQYENL